MGEVCAHDFVSRAGAVARGDCFACLRARLEETVRGALKTLEELRACLRRLGAAERELDFAHETIARLRDDAQAAEAALEKALDHLEWQQHNFPNAHGCAVRDQRIGEIRAILAPAEPLRTEGDVEPVEHCLHGRVVFGDPCPECCAMLNKAVAESLRTEGAPKLEDIDTDATVLGYLLGSISAALAEPLHSTEEAPEALDELLEERAALGADVRELKHRLELAALDFRRMNEQRAREHDERDLLRAQVERLEKALEFGASILDDVGRPKNAATLRLHLAPEAPVEKGDEG